MLADASPPVNRFEPAPIPNQDILAPRIAAASGAVVGPGLFQQKAAFRGDGYVQGSTPQLTQEPRRMPLPGISLKVPLN